MSKTIQSMSKFSLLNFSIRSALRLVILSGTFILGIQGAYSQSAGHLFLGRGLSDTELVHVNALVDQVQPCVYFIDGGVTHYGGDPKLMIMDVQSLSAWNLASSETSNVELVQIKISSGSKFGEIRLAPFSKLKNLKYIQILSEIDIPVSEIKSLLKDADPSWAILYTFSKPF